MRRRSKCEHYFHIVWATADRAPLITTEIEPHIYRIIGAEIANLKDSVIAIGGMPDHVHVLVQLPATVTVPLAVQRSKGASSRIINENRTSKCRFQWQGRYGSFTVSKSHLKAVSAYIANQEAHHADGTISARWEETDEEDPEYEDASGVY